MKTIKIGDVFGEVQEVQAETVQEALNAAGLSMSDTQQVIANSTSQPVSLSDPVTENEVYLLTSNQVSGN